MLKSVTRGGPCRCTQTSALLWRQILAMRQQQTTQGETWVRVLLVVLSTGRQQSRCITAAKELCRAALRTAAERATGGTGAILLDRGRPPRKGVLQDSRCQAAGLWSLSSVSYMWTLCRPLS